MSGFTKRVRETLKLCERLGFPVDRYEFGKHLKLYFDVDGVRFMVVASVTPSDRRSIRNLERNIKKSHREALEGRHGR